MFLWCCCAKWINRTNIPYLWALRGFVSTQEPPGLKRSLVSSQLVASYRFGIWSWWWSKCSNRCSVHSWSDGFWPMPSFTSGIHRCHLLSASIPLTGIVYNCHCGYASTWFICSICSTFAWCPIMQKPRKSGLLLTLDGQLLLERTIARLWVLKQKILFEVPQGPSPLSLAQRERRVHWPVDPVQGRLSKLDRGLSYCLWQILLIDVACSTIDYYLWSLRRGLTEHSENTFLKCILFMSYILLDPINFLAFYC